MPNVFRMKGSYRDDARNKDLLGARLEAIARYVHIRFSGTDKDMAERLWTARVQAADFERRRPDTPEAIQAWTIAERIAEDLGAKIERIAEDAKTIETIFSGHGYEILTLSDETRTAHVYVRKGPALVDVVTDRDPYTRAWGLGYHHIPSDEFDAWCGRVLDATNTRYARAMEMVYRAQNALGNSFSGGAAGLGVGMLLALPVAALSDPNITHALIFTMAGLGGIGTAAGAFAATKSELQQYLDACRVSRGRDALLDAVGLARQ